MVEKLGIWLAEFLNGYVLAVVEQMAGMLSPLAVGLLTLYIANYGFAVMRGEVSEPLNVFTWKVVKLGFILVAALVPGYYATFAMDTLTSLQDGMASVFVKAAGKADYGVESASSALGALDASFQTSSKLMADLWKEASMFRVDLLVAGVVYWVGLAIYMTVAAALVLMTKMVLTFVLAIGPPAILCLMFKPSARFFDSWLSTAISSVVLSWVIFFALGLALFVDIKLLDLLKESGAFNPGSLSSGEGVAKATLGSIEAAFGGLVVHLLLAYLLWHGPALASALTGGVSTGAGASQMIMYLMGRAGGGGGGGAGAAANSVTKGDAGGAVRQSAAAAYQRVSGMFNRKTK